MVVALAIHKKTKDFSDLTVFHHRAQADHSYVAERDLHFQSAGFDLEEVKLLYGRSNGPAADLFDHAYSMVWIYNFVADLKIQITIHATPRWGSFCGGTARQ